MIIGLLSDTHGHMDAHILHHLDGCDEIWHAGDVGAGPVLDQLRTLAPVKAVYGNIDDGPLQNELPESLSQHYQGLHLWMIHIGGRPGRYASGVPARLKNMRPDLFICGHSHILKVAHDPRWNHFYVNPGAAGHHGFHQQRTMLRLHLQEGALVSVEVVELGPRGRRHERSIP